MQWCEEEHICSYKKIPCFRPKEGQELTKFQIFPADVDELLIFEFFQIS